MVVILSLISCILLGVLIEFLLAPRIADILVKITDKQAVSKSKKH